MKKLYKTALILTIIAVLLIAILNSCVRLRSYDYKPVVSYESKNSEIAEIANATTHNYNNDLSLFGNVLRYEQVLLISSIILVIIFAIVFFNLKPKKK